MTRKKGALVALIAVFALIAAACGDTAETTTSAPPETAAPATTAAPETTAPPETEAPEETMAEETTTTEAMAEEVLACQVSDVGGIDDKSFNETAWRGALQAEEELEGVTAEFLESQAATDYRPNIDSFIGQGCDLITTVGFLLADDTGAAAADNPDQLFAIIDFPVGDFPPWCVGEVDPGEDGEAGTADDTCGGDFTTNVRGITFSTDEAAFLAGYLAAGMTDSGVIGTFGGINIPPVTIFMNGLVRGVDFYNAEKGTDVTVIGWDVDSQEGLFTGNFESLEDGRAFGQNLLDEGADIMLPVAGPVGLGTAALCQETDLCIMIGVDTDQFVSAPEFGPVWLTSIEKKMDVAVFDTISNVQSVGDIGDAFNGTLENGGVAISPFHDFDGDVSQELKDELTQLEADIIAGTVSVTGEA